MKTTGVSPRQPADTKTQSGAKAEKKGEPKHEFKEVLEKGDLPPGKILKGGHHIPLPKKTFKKGEEKGEAESGRGVEKRGGEKQVRTEQHAVVERKTGRRPDSEPEQEKQPGEKLGRESEPPLSVPANILMGPSTVQKELAVDNMRPPGGLNIQEIESIVQRVQVGVSEQGLPEMQFELSTKNLGDLGLKVTSEGEQIRVQFVTQDAAAQKELEKNLQDLGKVLQERGLVLAEANVMTRDQQSGRQQDQSSDQQGSGQEDFGSIKPAAGRKKPGFTL